MNERTTSHESPWYGTGLSCSDGTAIVKGLRIPAMVLSQLRALGIPLESLSRGEIEDAIDAVDADGTLIDDHEGATFMDKLTLTPEEKESRRDRKKAYVTRVVALHDYLNCDITDATDEQRENPWKMAEETTAHETIDIVHCPLSALFRELKPTEIDGELPPQEFEKARMSDVPS